MAVFLPLCRPLAPHMRMHEISLTEAQPSASGDEEQDAPIPDYRAHGVTTVCWHWMRGSPMFAICLQPLYPPATWVVHKTMMSFALGVVSFAQGWCCLLLQNATKRVVGAQGCVFCTVSVQKTTRMLAQV
jgi:hypothetical protein